MKILDILNENNLPPNVGHKNMIQSKEQLQGIYTAIENGDSGKAKQIMNNNPETYSDAMRRALEDDRLDVAEVLLKMGANPNMNNRNTISHIASNGEIEKLDLLHRYGGDLSDDATLNWAVQLGHLDTVKWLMKKGVRGNKNTFNMLYRFYIQSGIQKTPELVSDMTLVVLNSNPKPNQVHFPDMLKVTADNKQANSMLKRFGRKNGLTANNQYDKLGNLQND